MIRSLVTLFTLLATGPAAIAADACLTGAAQLDDQRALASLALTAETACPCATSASRRAYAVCTKKQVDAALASAALRPECKQTARAGFHDSTCGGKNRVACGRVDADGSVSCRIKRPNACRSRSTYAEHACRTVARCSDVVDWTAGTCQDVRVTGAYGGALRTISYTKSSASTPGTMRTLATDFWYPTAPGGGPIDSATGAILDAPIAAGGPFPVVMFSHGSCGYPRQSIVLTSRLASRGFIVVAPPHPGNTLFEFPACGTPAAQGAAFVDRPRDIIFVLDQLLAANADPASPFFGKVDGTRVTMSGHSFGGLTTYLAVALDTRFIAAMPMAPATLANSTLPVPSLYLLGAIDSVVNNTQTRAAYDRSPAPKHFASILNTGHYAFSDGCFPGADCQPPRTLTQAEANANVLRYAIPFLEVYGAGDTSFQPFLDAPAPPGFAFESAP